MPLRKLRTRQHVIADLGINYVERQGLVSGGAVQRMYSDYGYDLIMSTLNALGEIEPGIVFFQVKSTDNSPVLCDMMLEGKGLMAAEDFDRLVADLPVRHPASS